MGAQTDRKLRLLKQSDSSQPNGFGIHPCIPAISLPKSLKKAQSPFSQLPGL